MQNYTETLERLGKNRIWIQYTNAKEQENWSHHLPFAKAPGLTLHFSEYAKNRVSAYLLFPLIQANTNVIVKVSPLFLLFINFETPNVF